MTLNLAQRCDGNGDVTMVYTKDPSVIAPVYYFVVDQNGVKTSSNTGVFANLPAGTYTAVGGQRSCDSLNVTRTFTILPAGSPPMVNKNIGINCTNSNTADAFINYAGAGPFKIELRLTSQTDDDYRTLENSTNSTTHLFTGLQQNTSYYVRITDVCGNSTTSQLETKNITNLTRLTQDNPCDGRPFTLAVDDIPGATYSWTKNGVLIDTARSASINFSVYGAVYDGTYEVKAVLSNCATLSATYTISSANCGMALPVFFGHLNATMSNDMLFVNWSTVKEMNTRMFEIEFSTDGNNFRRIGTMESKSVNGNSNAKLEYTFSTGLSDALKLLSLLPVLLSVVAFRKRKRLAMLVLAISLVGMGVSCNKNSKEEIQSQGTGKFIRIVVVDMDGTKSYSKVIKVVNE